MCYNRLKCSRKIACIVVVALFFVLLAATDTVLAHWTGFDQSDANRGETISLNSWRSAVMPSQDWDDCYAIGPVYLFKTSNSKTSKYKISGINDGSDKMYIDVHYKNTNAGEWQYVDTVMVNSGFEYSNYFGLNPNGQYAILINRNAGGPYGGESYSIKVEEINPSKVTIPAGKVLKYTGKSQVGVPSGSHYTISGNLGTKAGNYTATLSLKDKNYYTWSDGTVANKKVSWKINKAVNPLTIKAKTATVKYSKLKKKTQMLTVAKVITFTKKGQGKMTYTKVSGNKKITINKTTGKVTAKKGLKKGTYKVKVKVKAAGNTNYKSSAWKTVILKIKVR